MDVKATIIVICLVVYGPFIYLWADDVYRTWNYKRKEQKRIKEEMRELLK